LPVPPVATAVSSTEIPLLFGWVAATFALLAIARGWRARRRLVVLSAPLEKT
jgi:hypothetical protein